MNSVAKLPQNEKALLFEATAQKRNLTSVTSGGAPPLACHSEGRRECF
jgi:hypothetical protein